MVFSVSVGILVVDGGCSGVGGSRVSFCAIEFNGEGSLVGGNANGSYGRAA